MQSSIAPTAALSAANGDERNFNINFNLHNTDIDEVAISEGKMNTPEDPQGSEITWATAGEFHGTTSAQHTSHRFIDTETILTETKYTFAEMIGENESTLGV